MKIPFTHSSYPVSFQSMDVLCNRYNLDYKELVSIPGLSKLGKLLLQWAPELKVLLSLLWRLQPRQVVWLAQSFTADQWYN